MQTLVQSLFALVLISVAVGTFGQQAPTPVPKLASYNWERSLESEEQWFIPPTSATTAPPVTTTTAPRASRSYQREGSSPTPAPVPSVQTPKSQDEILACIRKGESDSYQETDNPPYKGAYQFDQATWNGVTSRHKPELVGTDPAAASPADQDAMAWRLFQERGISPWPNRGNCD